MTRRSVLRGIGVALSLPWLESVSAGMSEETQSSPPARMLLISNNLGVLPDHFFPRTSGAEYEASDYLEHLAGHRADFTVFSGLSHPDVHGGHSTENCFLTGARNPTRSGFRNTISLDQYAAESLGPVSRFPTLNLGVNIDKANRSLAWTRDGVLLPAEDSAAAVFRRLFVQGRPDEVQQQLKRLDERHSILDTLQDDARRLQQRLGHSDRSRLDQYFTSIREVEQRIDSSRQWVTTPGPQTTETMPVDESDQQQFIRRFQLMLATARLALESDSTRIVTLMVDAFATPPFHLGPDRRTTDGYHNLSHHGQAPEKLAQLVDADVQQMQLLDALFTELAERRVGESRLLDTTMVLYGSNMGDSNTHDNTNLPILLAGGGFRHGRHLAFDGGNNTPLCNLFVVMLQHMGIETPTFGSSTGTLTGLD